jgi:hypothetical protein
MREAAGNIWDWLDDGAKIVIPTNAGWRGDGSNIMGAGLAKQAAERYPQVPPWYGAWCSDHAGEPCVVGYPLAPLIFFPTKPLNWQTPYASWKGKADLGTIRRSTKVLSSWPGDELIAVPLVGCGNGGLAEDDVVPLLHKYLRKKRFVLVRPA